MSGSFPSIKSAISDKVYTSVSPFEYYFIAQNSSNDKTYPLWACVAAHKEIQEMIERYKYTTDVPQRARRAQLIDEQLRDFKKRCAKETLLIEDLETRLREANNHILANPDLYFQNIPKNRWPVIIPRGGIPARR